MLGQCSHVSLIINSLWHILIGHYVRMVLTHRHCSLFYSEVILRGVIMRDLLGSVYRTDLRTVSGCFQFRTNISFCLRRKRKSVGGKL